MPSEFPRKDARNLWQDQTTEPLKMSLDLIRYKAHQREQKARFETIFSMMPRYFFPFSLHGTAQEPPISRSAWVGD